MEPFTYQLKNNNNSDLGRIQTGNNISIDQLRRLGRSFNYALQGLENRVIKTLSTEKTSSRYRFLYLLYALSRKLFSTLKILEKSIEIKLQKF